MLAVRNLVAGSHNKMPEFTRKPLQPRNSNVLNSPAAEPKSVTKREPGSNPVIPDRNSIIKGKLSEQAAERDWNKENIPVMMEGFDSSLGAELIEMRKMVERLKLDKEKTEERLKEKDAVLEAWRKDMERRGQVQIKLEIEMDRVYRINELKALTRISPIRSLRDKEEIRFRAAPLSILRWEEEDMEESVGENSIGSPAGSTGNSGAARVH